MSSEVPTPGLLAALARHAVQTPDKTALRAVGQEISYAQLWQRVLVAADSLREQGVGPGDRVAWLGLNDPAQVVLLLALMQIGGILVPLNHRLAPAELDAILEHAGVSLLLSDETHRALAGQLTECRGTADDFAVPEGAALLVYTSGTTGQPKGALHTAAGLLANCLASQHAHTMTADDHVLTVLPLFHVGGLCIQTLPALHMGAQVSLHPRFDAGAWLSEVAAQRPTLGLMVPATLKVVLEHPLFASTDLSSLRMLGAGSSVVSRHLIDPFHQRGVPVCQVYGATETGPVSICQQVDEGMRSVGSAGRAALNVQVRLVAEDGRDVPWGEVGEIWLKAPNLMQGYWRDDANAAFQDGWFRTGDLARLDHAGDYWVVGRSKDMVISGGENIYPAELENLLAACPGVAEAAAFGVADPQWGESLAAAVVRQPGSALDAEQLRQWLDGRIARYKWPRRFIFVEALPRTALGKVIKDDLKRLVFGNS